MLLTDVGFSGTGDRVPADPGSIPEGTLYDRDGAPDLVFGVDYTEISAFGSGADLQDNFRGDIDFRPAWSVTTGFGYEIWNAQLAYLGFEPGFASAYATLDFKVKGLSGDVIRVKFLDDPDPPYLDINVTTSAYSTALGNGWYQVSVPIGAFEGTATGTGLLFETIAPAPAESFTYLLTDIGFSGSRVPADPGIIPDVTLYDRDGMPDLEFGVDYTEITAFGSGADLDGDFRGDPDFQPAWSVTTGFGYSIWNAQLAYLGFAPGFASAYSTLDFKVKDLSGDVIRVKFLNDPDPPYVDVNVVASSYSTSLGNGWYQVSVPIEAFEGIATSSGLLFETIAPAPAESFTYLLTDIGFSGDGPVDPTISVDFEGDPSSYDFGPDGGFDGGKSTVLSNPDQSGINTSGQVVKMEKFAGQPWGGSTLALPEGVDWAQGETFTMKVWASRSVPVLFKLEGLNQERSDDHTGGSAWQELCFDFAGTTSGNPVTGITIIFDLGVMGDAANDPANWTFYYDDIQQGSGGCGAPPAPEWSTITFDDPEVTYTLTDFGGTGSTVTNDPAGGTNQVVQTVKSGAAAFWAGTTVSTLPGDEVPVIPLDASNTEMSVRVYSPDAGIPVRLKIENASAGAISVETEASTTTVNAWETLTFDFANEAADTPAFDPAATYNKVSIFFNFGTDGATAGEKQYYFDDIAVGAGSDVTGIIPDVGAYVSDPVTMNEDLAPPGGIQNFGSGAAFTDILTDPDYPRVLQVESGEGYGAGVHVGFAAFTGYTAGFAEGFDTLHFKVKGDAANLADFEVKFFAPDTSMRYDLTSYAGATDLGNGWIQVSIPMSDFAANIAANDGFLLGPFGGQAAPFAFQMTDIGFSASGDPGTGIIPEFGAYVSDPATMNEDLGPPGGIQNFGSGAVFTDILTDPDYLRVLQVESGEGYGAGVHVGFAAFTGYTAGFAQSLETLHFKVKGDPANLADFEVKFFAPDTSQRYDLTSYAGATDLGNGWIQVSIPMSDFAANIAANDGFLLGPFGGQAAPFAFQMTDIGFSGSTGGGGPGEIAVNGGFETGDFTGWEQFANGAVQVVTDVNPSSGTYAANLNIPVIGAGGVAVDNLIKNANLEAGNLTPGAAVTVSFDMRGSLSGAGGVVFAELFSELAGGGTSKAEILSGGPLAPADAWTSYVFNTTLGPDVAGGVTLQLKVGCGAVEGCGADVYFDNVSIVIN